MQCSTPSNAVYILMFLTKCLTLVDHVQVNAEIHLAIPQLANRLGLSPRELFSKNRQIISKVLLDACEPNSLEGILTHASEIFKDSVTSGVRRYLDQCEDDLYSFVLSYIRHFLPGIVTRSAVENKPELMQAFMNCVQIDCSNGKQKESLLIDNFQHILAYLVFFHPLEMVEKTLKFVSTVTGKHLVDIRRCTIQTQVNELVLGLPCYPKECLTELFCLSLLDATSPSSNVESTESLNRLLQQQSRVRTTGYKLEDVRHFIKKRCLGVLVYLDTKMISIHPMQHEKALSVWSLIPLLSLVGPDGVGAVARKILSTLKTAQESDDSDSSWYRCALAWRTFILNLRPALLPTLIQEIMVLVSAVLVRYPRTIGPVLNRLLDVHPELASSFEHLPSLPQIKELSVINTVSAQMKRNTIGGLKGLIETLTIINEGLKHGSNDVKRHNLQRLLHLLYTKKLPMVTADSMQCDVVTQLYTLLLGLCRSSEGNLQELVARSLGLLGAIDPARLKLFSLEQQEEKQVHLSNSSSGFICDLLMELARSFLSATDSNIQLCASFAMQELLRIYKIEEKSESKGQISLGNEVWCLLPTYIRDVIQPFYNSRYTITGANTPRPNIANDIIWTPLYGSCNVQTFRQWLTEWMIVLLNLVEDDKDYNIFNVCKPIFKRDLNTALHLLFPLIISILVNSPHHHTKIATEILAVTGSERSGASASSESSLDDKTELISNYDPKKQMRQLSVETVFSVLDNIKVRL